jgi:hypothetical protein
MTVEMEGGDWHAIHVISADHPDDWDLEVLHPETCQVTISHPPDEWMGARHFTCSLTEEVSNVGYEQIFGDMPVTVGWYFVKVEYYVVSTMEGDDVDGDIQTFRVMPPRHKIWQLDEITSFT